MNKIVITGGAGFIGSHIVDEFAERYPDAQITVLDKMTYAADIQNIMHHLERKDFRLIVGDLRDMHTCVKAVEGADLIIHAAAESHVDNSFGNSIEFSKTNVEGTHCLMEAARQHGVPKIIHVSTDEVYGEILEGAAHENSPLLPTNPYSASKAAAEMIINSYKKSFSLPVIIVRANNIFGIRQYPEKLIPKFINLLAMGQKLTIHGTGKNTRHFLAARDFARALFILTEKGVIGECYNIGTTQEFENIQVSKILCELFGVNPEEYITYVEDRPFNDARYAVVWDKISALGWKPEIDLLDQLPSMAQWYVSNLERYHNDGVRVVNRPVK